MTGLLKINMLIQYKPIIQRLTPKIIGFALLTTGMVPSFALTECEFIERTINRLGSRMAILRLTIASTEDRRKQDLASEQLNQYTAHYRQAKRQLKKAHCQDNWMPD